MVQKQRQAEAVAALLEAVEIAGSQSALAAKVNKCLAEQGMDHRVKQAHVWNWLNRQHEAPADCVLAVEACTGVSRHRLRRDVFGLAPVPIGQEGKSVGGGCST